MAAGDAACRAAEVDVSARLGGAGSIESAKDDSESESDSDPSSPLHPLLYSLLSSSYSESDHHSR